MKLEELLNFDKIVIQCHDNPDADAIASGYAILTYLRQHKKKARLVYGGALAVQKSNLLLMIEELKIPIRHIKSLKEEPDLLLTVDCTYGERNVQRFSGKQIGVIDHHQIDPEKLPSLYELRSSYGACSTIVWDMLSESGFSFEKDKKLATALYYGLFMDTGKLEEIRHPRDKDMRDELVELCSKDILTRLQNCNLSLKELSVAGQALIRSDYHPARRFAIVEAEPCDPNILGVISDMVIEVDVVDTCIVYCMLNHGAKYSVRSCVKETKANELAAFVAENLGSGGGHPRKGGGFLREKMLISWYENRYGLLDREQLSAGVNRILLDRMEEYFREQEIVYAHSKDTPDLSGEPVYEKRRLPMGYVRATDLYPAGTIVNVRMLEGDTVFEVTKDTYFIFGVESEIYRNDRAYFLANNEPCEEPYEFHGEYAPRIQRLVTVVGAEEQREKPKLLKDYVKTCIPKKGSLVHARQLKRRTKVFVSWSEDYMLGMPGDWLVARQKDLKDVYIVKKDIFEKTYEKQ